MRAGTDTPQYFPRKLSLEEAVNEYVNLTGRKRLFSGSILLDRLDGLLGGRLTAHHLLRGSLLPTIQLDFTKPFDLTAGEDTPNSMKPFEVGMTLGQAVGANITSLGGNPTLEDSARALAQVMVLVSRSERVSDLRKALNDHEVELVPVGNDYIFARMREREIIRQPLPEKAPADSTWLSPFGPLTTKAAKAAEAKLKADSIDEVFEELDYSIKNTGNLAANALAAAQTKANNFLEKHVANPQLAFGKHSLGEMLIELRKARKKSVLISATLMKNAGGWVTNEATLTTTTDGRTKEIEAGFTNANIGLILANEATLVFPLPRKTEFQKIYDSKGIVPFKNGPPDEKVLKVRQKNYSLLYTYSLIIALVCGTAGLPHILVRFYTNPDGVAAKRTTMWVMILIGVFYVFPPVFGVLGRNLMPELYNGLTGVKGTDGIVLKLPTILREKYGVLGSILSGVTCAGAFAAFMSTFSGLLVSMTGALAHDVYGRMLNPKATPAQRLRMFKLAAVLIGGVAIVLGSFVEPLEINFMVGQAFAIAAASYFPLLFMSVWWRGMTMRGAAIGMLSGGLCALAAVTLTNVSNLALDKGPMGKIFAGFAPMNQFWAGHPLLRILCEQPAIWTVPLAIGLMIVVSKATRRSVPGDIRMKMLVLHAPEKLGLKQEYIQEHQHGH
ncbi:MAG: cation acetate symporter [Verrucomicrobia bacterium]|nr:cation acetate symporter [Verrucomicrobiota bacterium]